MITTIITTYKRPHLLKRALKSVLNQTYPHFKVCVYDNASNDETEEMMREFMKADSRIEYHKHPKNIGMMANYAYGYSRIDTPYFSFLSDDDYLLPWFYETALEGFNKYPDAAFSACGVLAVDINNNVVADPLSGWRREGYYSVPEGIFEMISSKYTFPPPQGVLFQYQLVKDISPDWSKEIQLMWDPDYLIQIASHLPIVISKKIASIFFAHEGAFSTGFYKRILRSAKFLDEYFAATSKLLQRVIDNPHIADRVKSKIRKTYVKMLGEEIGIYMRYFIENAYYSESYYSGKILLKNFGFNVKVLNLLIETISRHKFPRFSRKAGKLISILKRKTQRFRKPKENPLSKWRSFEEHKDYAQSI